MVQIIAPAGTSELSAADTANAKTVQLPPAPSKPAPTEPTQSPRSSTPKNSPTSAASPKPRASSSSADPQPATPRPSAAAATASVAESSEELFAHAAQMLSDDAPPESPTPTNSGPPTDPPTRETPTALPAASKFATYRLVAMVAGGVVIGGLLMALMVRAILSDDAPVAQVEPPTVESPVEPKAEAPETEPATPDENMSGEKIAVEPDAEIPVTDLPQPTETDPAAMPAAVVDDQSREMPLDETKPTENPFLFDDPVRAKPAVEDVAAADSPETTDEQRMKFANDPLTGVLGEAFPLFDESMFNTPESQSIAEAADPAMPVPDPAAQMPPEPLIEKPAPRQIDITARLQDPFIRINFLGIPLQDHLRNLTRWSTIPISVDPLALQSADIQGDKKINVRQESATTERLLRSAVEPLRMSMDVASDHIRIVPLKSAGDKPPTIRFQVDDLASDEKALAELAYTLTHLVDPTSWQGAGGTNTCRTDKRELQLSADSKTVFQALVLVEKLRVARGKSPRSRYQSDLFKLEPRNEQAAAMLDKKVQLSFVEPAELIEIVEQLEDSTGTVILIDWNSLLPEGWNPDTKGTMLAIDVTLGEALQTLLKPLEMDFRVIDERTLQIAMKTDIEQQGFVEFYPIRDLADGPTQAAALIHRLKTELAIADDPEVALLYDETSKHLLVRLPQPKQLEMAAALAKMRTP